VKTILQGALTKFNAESHSVNNSYQWKSPLGQHNKYIGNKEAPSTEHHSIRFSDAHPTVSVNYLPDTKYVHKQIINKNMKHNKSKQSLFIAWHKSKQSSK